MRELDSEKLANASGSVSKLSLILVTVALVSLVLTSYLLIPALTRSLSLRIDLIPTNAITVPRIELGIQIRQLDEMTAFGPLWNLDQVMIGAWRTNFTMKLDLSNETRLIPSTLLLGHDSDYLYVGAIFAGLYANPVNHSLSSGWWSYNTEFKTYLDADNHKTLDQPEAGMRTFAALACVGRQPNCDNSGWNRTVASWGDYPLSWRDHVWWQAGGAWVDFTDLQDSCSNLTAPYGDSAVEYNSITGTFVVIQEISLHTALSCSNALSIRQGERWVIGFLFEIGFYNGYTPSDQTYVGWPETIFPYTSNNVTMWPRIAIDLRNPR